MNNKDILNKLTMIMKEVGEYQVEKFISKNFKMTTKSTDIDVVTEVDRSSEDMLINSLSRHFPTYGFLAEESGSKNLDHECIWIIDPLDGTTNFSTGIPIFAISVALQKNDTTILAAVYNPMIDTMYTAIKGEGAFKNNHPIKVNDTSSLREAVIATGFPYDRAENPINNVHEFSLIAPTVKGIRRLGVAAYDLCLVAEGVFSGYWEYGLKPWDYAAGLLIALEAGATYEWLPKREHSIIVSNPEIFQVLKTQLEF